MAAAVSIVPCCDYTPDAAASALTAALEPLGGLDWVLPGMRIGIKVNLLRAAAPESATVTHPVLVAALCRMLSERGAVPIVGDSPGGPWTAAFVNNVCRAADMYQIEAAGGRLNSDFSVCEINCPDGTALRRFPCTTWLQNVDAVINFAKLKTHGLTTMTAGVKNLFGVIPGTRKVELHCRFPDVDDFANMLLDLNEAISPVLTLIDAVDAMEGNGPANGTPRRIGALIAAETSYAADLLCAHLITLPNDDVPTIRAAIERGLCPASVAELQLSGDPAPFVISGFKNLPPQRSAFFSNGSPLKRALAGRFFSTRPKIDTRSCTGCGVCVRACPAKAVSVTNRKAVIDKGACIRCFCCQELCPSGVIAVHRSMIAKLLTK